MVTIEELFTLAEFEHAEIFADCRQPWDVLSRIESYLLAHLKRGLHHRCEGIVHIGQQVYIGPGTVVEHGAMIKGPAIIGRDCQIRHNAYIRENVIIGNECLVGNASEVKNAIFFNNAVAPHFNYVGDSVLGHKAHLGAGVKISNFKLVPGTIKVEEEGGLRMDTGLRKFGALLGDHTEVGCNTVLNPGTIIGRGGVIYPNINWRGMLKADTVVKNRAPMQQTPKRAEK
jgi:NDP-sugar pyrophosphorylase family protein